MKKTLDTNTLPEKQKITHQIKENVGIKPKLEQGRAGVKHKKPQVTKNLGVVTNKLQEIPRVSTVQNVPKIVQTFQCINNQ